MGGHKSISGTSYEVLVPVPTPDYIITGDLVPDATGNYFLAGTYGGYPYYKKTNENFFLWQQNVATWYISWVLGERFTDYWKKLTPPITGQYLPYEEEQGVAAVSAGG